MKESLTPCVVGVGQSQFTRWGGIQDRSQFQLTAESVCAALVDAGLTVSDVDGFGGEARRSSGQRVLLS